MRTIKDLIDWSINHGTKVSIIPDIVVATPVVRFQFHDLIRDKCFSICADTLALRYAREDIDIIDHAIRSAELALEFKPADEEIEINEQKIND